MWQSSFPSRYSLEMLEIGQITQKVETQTNEVRVMGEEDPQGLACIIQKAGASLLCIIGQRLEGFTGQPPTPLNCPKLLKV
jgi:hypothetical protein